MEPNRLYTGGECPRNHPQMEVSAPLKYRWVPPPLNQTVKFVRAQQVCQGAFLERWGKFLLFKFSVTLQVNVNQPQIQ